MPKFDSLQGVILAAGLSSRMGFSKALAPPWGEGLGPSAAVQTGLAALAHGLHREGGASVVHAVVNAGVARILTDRPALLGPAPVRLVINSSPDLGQFHSLRLGLTAARDAGAALALVALVDILGTRGATLGGLVAAAVSDDRGKLVIAAHGGHRGHTYVVPRRLFDTFIHAPTASTARDVLDGLGTESVRLEVDDAEIRIDRDSLRDLPVVDVKKPPARYRTEG